MWSASPWKNRENTQTSTDPQHRQRIKICFTHIISILSQEPHKRTNNTMSVNLLDLLDLLDLFDLLYQTDSQSATICPPTPRENPAMFMFANHAAYCTRCADPIQANLTAGVLCDLGNLFAWELTKYVYAKDGGAYSLLDRQQGQSVEIELPGGLFRYFEAVQGGASGLDTGAVELDAWRGCAGLSSRWT